MLQQYQDQDEDRAKDSWPKPLDLIATCLVEDFFGPANRPRLRVVAAKQTNDGVIALHLVRAVGAPGRQVDGLDIVRIRPLVIIIVSRFRLGFGFSDGRIILVDKTGHDKSEAT